MPLGWQRLNTRQKGPNESIVFIKPLEGPDEATAQDFLERIAAICVPIMKANHLAVVSLEEHVPNSEFVGRNFNAGEVIQLVLKAPGTGRWLPFSYVQMVMMHELAHCKQMNHSKAFWKVRNQYADELKVLWSKGYTGEGLWGRGQALYTGQYTEDSMPASDYLYEHPCGGTYRTSRRGKRKRKDGKEKPKLSYAEQKQRRILKKFGAGGTALGDDDSTRIKLEDGKKPAGKPRVASSKRGRDLRAAAALARFGQSQEQQPIKEESETDSEYESDFDSHESGSEAVDTNGRKLTDSKGNGLVKVCEDEDVKNDPEARNELKELSDIRNWAKPVLEPDLSKYADSSTLDEAKPFDTNGSASSKDKGNISGGRVKSTGDNRLPFQKYSAKSRSSTISNGSVAIKEEDISTASESEGDERPFTMKDTTNGNEPIDRLSGINAAAIASNDAQICEVCSLANEAMAVICAACSHVLDPQRDPESWHCKSLTCRGGNFINAGDAGICALCGARKPIS